jgi:predicted aminopeptidase
MLTEIPRRPWIALLLLAAALLLLPGCEAGYLLQAADGEWHVLAQRKPIDKVIADPATPPPLKKRLALVLTARDFASRQLHLPDNQSYRTYVDLKRPYVVWNVVAVPELSVTPKTWCFPIAGCVAYHGYFKEESAHAFAAKLAAQGYDVVIDDVPTYSTLGRFADPVLSTMLRYGDDALAAEIFHELAHQLLYVEDDSSFNEAFATAVEDEGLARWVKSRGGADRRAEVEQANARERQFVELFAATRAELAGVYAGPQSTAAKRAAKAQIFARLPDQIRALEKAQGVHAPLYEEWIQEGLNNARLASLATYYDCVPGFEHLLQEQGGDLPRFYAAARELSRLPIDQRHARLCSSPAPSTSEGKGI